MRKEEVTIEGDRYLIYYWFDDERSASPNHERESETRNQLTSPSTRSSNETEEIEDER